MGDDSALRARLTSAADTGEVLRIIYRGGSQPGSARDVCPVEIKGDLLRAHDVAAGADKQFRLSNIEIVDAQVTAPAYDPHFVHPPATVDPSIGDHFAPMVAELQALGWHVQLSEDALFLSGYFKNGLPRRGVDVQIKREDAPTGGDDVDDGTLVVTVSLAGVAISHEEAPQRAPRPWRPYFVGSASTLRRFGYLDRAAELFLSEARALAPKRDTRAGPA
jgi:hypothetical protein